MAAIYEPRGRAREYSELALNLYTGCSHGCKYCYAPSALRKTRQAFGRAEPRKDILKKIEADCRRLDKMAAPRILLCFTCDPYQPDNSQITREALRIIKGCGLSVQLLTKGGLRAERDYDLLGEGDAVAATLTFISEDDSREWEPAAALPGERMEGLRRAKARGIETWASLEPVIDPEQSLDIIMMTRDYVDLYKIGKLNYHPLAKSIDWRGFAMRAIEILESLGKQYYIKRDLREHIGKAAARTDVQEDTVEEEAAARLF